ncbi:MAG: hypothetical protein QOK43_2906 [Acidimicrobiaceae bacterium]|nr:hypothetical protein [Acidimicrobiaceae bacterium]
MNDFHNQDALRRVIDATWPELIDGMVAAVLDRVIAYSEVPAKDLRDSIERTAGLFVRAIFGEWPTETELDAIAVQGSHRARQGLDPDSLAAGVDGAAEAGLRHVMELAAQTEITDATALVRLLTDVATNALRTHGAVRAALARGYADARAGKLADDALRTALLVDRVLRARLDWAPVEDELRALGMPVADGVWGVFVLVGDPASSDALPIAAHASCAEFVEALEGQARSQPVPHNAIVAVVQEPEGWEESAAAAAAAVERLPVLVVASKTARRLRDLPADYELFTRNLEFAHVFPTQSGNMLDVAAMQLCRALADGHERDQALFFNLMLGDLVDHRDAHDLFPVIEAMATTGTLEAAAEFLRFDVQTIKRRGRQIRAITRRSWRNNLDRHLLTQAITFRRLAADSEDYSPRTWGPR